MVLIEKDRSYIVKTIEAYEAYAQDLFDRAMGIKEPKSKDVQAKRMRLIERAKGDVPDVPIDWMPKDTDELKIFLTYLNEIGGIKILDLGCGLGLDSKFFKEMGYSVTALDGSLTMARLAADNICESVVYEDLLEFSSEEKYDAIYAAGVFHHLDTVDMAEALENYLSMLNPGGLFYISALDGNKSYVDSRGIFYQEYDLGELYSVMSFNRINNAKIIDYKLIDDRNYIQRQFMRVIIKKK